MGTEGTSRESTTEPLLVGNASGFYGDRFAAMREMLEGGPLHVLTGDYLAELTMLILGRAKLKDPGGGYATTFLRQMEECMGLALDRGVKIVVNAGGLNPSGLAARLADLADRLGLGPRIAHVEGDDLLPRAKELGLADGPYGVPLTANAYLGAWGIVACLRAGADIVVTGRVTDASLVVGPAAAHFGWSADDHDALAGATVAGHVLECGAQTSGGNFAFFTEINDMSHPGLPIAEIHADGSSVITKHPGTGGAVTVETVTAQLVYEIAAPRYPGPDVTTLFDSIRLERQAADRVHVSEVRGEPPPPTTKVCLNHLGGFRNEMTFVLTGLDIEAKARLVRDQLESALEADRPEQVEWTMLGAGRPDAASQGEAATFLRVAVKDREQRPVGRSFSGAAVELALAGYPGFTMTAPPGNGAPFGVYTAAFVANDELDHIAVLPDGTRSPVAAPTCAANPLDAPPDPPARPENLPEPYAQDAPTVRAPLGRVAGARSGDKGGDANIGVWARTGEQWRWLAHFLTAERLGELLPEVGRHTVTRHLLPNLRAVNFVVTGLLQEGVSASTRFDPQGKALGEWLRSRVVDIPEALL